MPSEVSSIMMLFNISEQIIRKMENLQKHNNDDNYGDVILTKVHPKYQLMSPVSFIITYNIIESIKRMKQFIICK